MRLFRSTAGGLLLMTGAYTAIALVMSYPLVRRLGSFTMAGAEDGAMSVWNIWWVKYALVERGGSMLETDMLFYPDGGSVTFHSLPKVVGIISVPLQYLAGVTQAYNIVFLMTFVLTALATYWLVYHLVGSRIPAFLAGAVFAFSPYRWDHAGHLQLLSTMLIPVYILFIIKGREALADGGWRPWLYFSIAGAAMAVTGYDSEYYAIFLLIFSAIYFLFYMPLRWNRQALKRWGLLLAGLILSMAVFALVFAPMLVAALNEIENSGDYIAFPLNLIARYSANPLDFVTPQPLSYFFGSYFHEEGKIPVSDTVFLGWMTIILAAVAVWRYRRQRDTWLWVVTALVFGALAMGPYMIIYGKIYPSVFGPYLLISKIPLISAARVPARFGVMVMLAFTLLAAMSIEALFTWMKRRNWGRIAIPAATALLLLVIYVEYRPEANLSSTATPDAYLEIAASDTSGSVVSLPLGWEAGDDVTGLETTFVQLYQIEHERPLVGGMMARQRRQQVFRGVYTPVIDFLADPVALEPSDLDRDPEAIAATQERFQVEFIVAHKRYPQLHYRGGTVALPTDLTPEALERLDDYVTRYLGMEKFAEDEEIVAYRRR